MKLSVCILRLTLLVLILWAVIGPLACALRAGCYSYGYGYPTYPYCTPCYEPYHYDCAGWCQGRWYPAGWYQWRGTYWHLRGYGPCHGYASPEAYYGHGTAANYCPPTYVTQFQGLVGIPIPTYYSTYTQPPPYPAGVGANTASAGAVAGTGVTGYGGTAATPPAPQQTTTLQQPSPDTQRILTAITTLDGNVKTLDQRTRDFESRLRKLESGSGNQEPDPLPPAETPPAPETPPPMPGALTAAGVLSAHCARCHTAGRLFNGTDARGDDRHASLALFTEQGTAKDEIPAPMLDKLIRHVIDGTMPPRDILPDLAPLSGGESDALTKWATALKQGSTRLPERRSRAKAHDPLTPLRSALADLQR